MLFLLFAPKFLPFAPFFDKDTAAFVKMAVKSRKRVDKNLKILKTGVCKYFNSLHLDCGRMVEMENCCLIALIEKFKKRDMSSFPVIFGKFEKLIYFYAARLDGEDTFQELAAFLLELLYKIDVSAFKKNDGDNLKRYIAASIGYKYIALVKSRSRIVNVSDTLFETVISENNDFFETEILKDAVSMLPPRQKQIIIYKYIYNYSDIEIAAHLKITRQAVNRLKNRAMENLRHYYMGIFKMYKEITIFRVRESFDDIKSQKGAFFIFETAVKTAQKFGFNVYGNNGELLFKTTTEEKL